MTTTPTAPPPNTISVDDWLRFIGDEYLRGFIREGGAAVKFVLPPAEQRGYLSAAFKKLCRELGYLCIELDAARMDTKVHMPQDLFIRMAEQVDWRRLARRAVRRLAESSGLAVAGIDPTAADNIYSAIAHANGIETNSVYRDLRPLLEREVAKNPAMAKDFRVAMEQLCVWENVDHPKGYAAEPIQDWLKGVPSLSRVRPFSIYTPINRTTARYFIESALYWIRWAGYSGTGLLLDNSRVTVNRDPRDGRRYYTRATTLEHYELLREFIDGVDRLTAALLVVASSPEFLDEDAGSRARGYGIYPALRTRVMDDVRDRNLVNPAASLVRLS